MFAPQEFTTAQVNGHAVRVLQEHRRWTATDYVLGASESDKLEPVAVTVTAPLALSLEDIAAVLFDLGVIEGGDEFDDDGYVRLLVAETVVNHGSSVIEEVRCRLGERTLTADTGTYLAYCRERAAAVFGAPAPAQGRQLAGVA